jgi:hypothetical protein
MPIICSQILIRQLDMPVTIFSSPTSRVTVPISKDVKEHNKGNVYDLEISVLDTIMKFRPSK